MIIRIANFEDIEGILGIYGPIVEGSHTSFEYTVPSHVEMSRRLEETLTFYPWIVARSGKDIAGYAYATRFRKRKAYERACEVSVYVHTRYRRKGVGKKLYSVILDILKRQGITQCIAGISLPNQASIDFHIKCGFRKVGIFHKVGFKFGQWYDVLFMQYELNGTTDGRGPVPWHKTGQPELIKRK